MSNRNGAHFAERRLPHPLCAMRNLPGKGNCRRRAGRPNTLLPAIFFLLGTLMSAQAQPARIIVIRHAEKTSDDSDPNLAPEGLARSQRLVTWILQESVLGSKEPPAALYAAAPSAQGRGIRCVQTLQPLAEHLQLRVRTPDRPDEYAKLARHLLRSSFLRGKIVVVCWTHEELPMFAGALGVTPAPPKWKEKDFSGAYIITFSEGSASLEHAKQKLKKR